MANANFVGTWVAVRAKAQNGTILQLKKNDFATIVIEEDAFGFLTGRMERKKLFGRVDSADIVISETNDPSTIQIMQALNALIATHENVDGCSYLKTTWFSNTPHLNGVIVLYQKQ